MEKKQQRASDVDAGKVQDIDFPQFKDRNASEENQSSSQQEETDQKERDDHSITISPNISTVCWILEKEETPIKYDHFSGQILVSFKGNSELEAWTEHLSLQITMTLQQQYSELRNLSKTTVDQAVQLYARDHSFNQLTDKLNFSELG